MSSLDRILDHLEHATIVSGRVDEGEGLCLDLDNGYTLVIAGMFAISLEKFDKEKLH